MVGERTSSEPAFFDERCEGGIARDGDEVDFGFAGGCAARSPAEVDQVVFTVEVEVAWGVDGCDFAAGALAAAGFEGD